MPIIHSGEQARLMLNGIIDSGKAIPCFCTESVYTTEAIFSGARAYKNKAGMNQNLPLIIAFTASYEDRQQLKNYTGLQNFREGLLAVRSDIERLARNDGPYSDLDVIVHLDHAQPGQDDWIISEHSEWISSVMWDCSKFSRKDNIAMVRDFVTANGSRFIVEGAVDEIYNYNADDPHAEIIDEITDPSTAQNYFSETGVDLLVANLGTEHRRTEGTVLYHGEIARMISERVGRRLVLHGTSSLNEGEFENLAADGIVKVNLWGKLESQPGTQLVTRLIRELEHQLPLPEVQALVSAGYLNEKMLEKAYKPSIHYLTEKFRRDEVYLPEAVQIVRNFYEKLYGDRDQ
jgi:fructose-bisphosphate aldolase class II